MEKKSKETKMNAARESSNKNEKLSYEELEHIALQARAANNDLYQRLQHAQNVIAEFNEIGMLLDILGKAEYFKEAFVQRCSNKIEELVGKAIDASEKVEEENTQENKD